MSAYQWKVGTVLQTKISADVAAQVCNDLEARGQLNGKALVDASRPEDAPLHGAFEWNDAIAAEKYREEQGSYIIRHLEVSSESLSNQPVRAYFSVEPTVHYQKTETILSAADSRACLLDKALKELNCFKLKYACLSELAKLFAEIDELEAGKT